MSKCFFVFVFAFECLWDTESYIVFFCAVRYHTVQEFNKGVYDYIIATDEGGLAEKDDESEDEEEREKDERESLTEVATLD